MGKRRAFKAARRLLARLGIDPSPPVNVQRIARALGIAIVERPGFALKGQGTVSGMLLRREGRTICAINQDHHPNRKRFSVAHELGHHELHPFQEAYIDQDIRSVARDARSAEGTDLREIEANAFAAELLMPEEGLRSEVRYRLDPFEDEEVKRLARRYKVSAQAMTIRLTELGLLVA